MRSELLFSCSVYSTQNNNNLLIYFDYIMQAQINKINIDEEYFFAEGCFVLELSNTQNDPEASIARARVEPGVTTRLHRLRDITERYVIIEGCGRVEIGDNLIEDVLPGDVVIIPPYSPQRITNTGETDLIFLAICTPRFTVEAYEDVHNNFQA